MSSVERWRLPTDEEWKALAMKFGGYFDWEQLEYVDYPEKAYKALLEGDSDSYRSRFSALLGGWRNTDGSFSYLGHYGHYWSATESGGSHAWSYHFFRSLGHLLRLGDDKAVGFSCRC
ncbi:MAG: hypothetical protein KDD10_24580, partial [Phaeodactylibacter sp.]|nr:hypothetical protein [Phaeodactylibacter sp.]